MIRHATRSGHTVLELVIVLLITGILLSVAVPRGRLALDRISVMSAATELRTTLESARAFALAGRAPVVAVVDTAIGLVRLRQRGAMLLQRRIGELHGVRLAGARDSVVYDGRGLGFGLANVSVIVRRGAAAETVFVSRLGRVR